MEHKYSRISIVFWIVVAFIAWVAVFWGYLSCRLGVFEDAGSYFEHTKFFIENVARGVYPLWDPYWMHGAPNDFFLRRIGAFNPFYFVIPLLECFGLSYKFAYVWFLALYFWSAMIAFYLLAMRMFNNRLIAYAGYVLLLFSSLGTRLFDSYMMIITIPILWFTFFLVAFTQTPRRHLFLGLCLSLIILCSTYIPFYFLCGLFLFCILFVFFYTKSIPEIFSKYITFIKHNKILVIGALLVVALSLIPLLSFFSNSAKGQIVLPARQGNELKTGSALVVPTKTLDWGAPEDLLFSYYFTDLSRIRFAVVYVPFFALIVFALGCLGRINRRALFIFVLGFVLMCCLIPHGLPFYDFLYDHVFFLKYFRNLHFFLWFILIPLFVVLVLEHWKLFTLLAKEVFWTKKRVRVFIWMVHVLMLAFVYWRQDAIITTYVMIGLSALFWTLSTFDWFKGHWALGLLTLTLLVQPVEVYHYLTSRAGLFIDFTYKYDWSFNKINLTSKPPGPESTFADHNPAVYYAAGSYNVAHQNVRPYALAKYLQHTFQFVDHVDVIDPTKVDFSILDKSFVNNWNKAFVFESKSKPTKQHGNDPTPAAVALKIENEGNLLRILSFNVNKVVLETNLPYEKFLVYNDSYDDRWQVTVNGKAAILYQTNVGFKGVWLPAGKSRVMFHFGSWKDYALEVFLLGASVALLGGIFWNLWFYRKQD